MTLKATEITLVDKVQKAKLDYHRLKRELQKFAFGRPEELELAYSEVEKARSTLEKLEAELTRARPHVKCLHPFTGDGSKCSYDWPNGDERSEPCGLPRSEHYE